MGCCEELKVVYNSAVILTGFVNRKKAQSMSFRDQSNGIMVHVIPSLSHLRNLRVILILQQKVIQLQKEGRLKMVHQALSSVAGSWQTLLCLLSWKSSMALWRLNRSASVCCCEGSGPFSFPVELRSALMNLLSRLLPTIWNISDSEVSGRTSHG